MVKCHVRWEGLPRLCDRISYRTDRLKRAIFLALSLQFRLTEGLWRSLVLDAMRTVVWTSVEFRARHRKDELWGLV